jgi:hypothetical protein
MSRRAPTPPPQSGYRAEVASEVGLACRDTDHRWRVMRYDRGSQRVTERCVRCGVEIEHPAGAHVRFVDATKKRREEK